MAFATALLPPHKHKRLLLLLILQHIQQFAVRLPQKFIKPGVAVVGKIKNQLVHGAPAYGRNGTAQLYAVLLRHSKARRQAIFGAGRYAAAHPCYTVRHCFFTQL